MTLTADHLRVVLADHEEVVDQALEALFPDPAAPISLDVLELLTEPGQDLADVLRVVIMSGGKVAALEVFLNARGIMLVQRSRDEDWNTDAVPFIGDPIAEPNPNDLPLEKVGPFALQAHAFRCRILLDGNAMGSGAFISKRLVLTAAHVVEDVIQARAAARATGVVNPVLPVLEIKTSDGNTYSARCVWSLPVHDAERTGSLPPVAAFDTHQDVALLQVNLPLGINYGFCDVRAPVVDWQGSRLMTLVHFPEGNMRGLTLGRVHRDTSQDVRLRHNVDTQGGSSGGPAFDRELQFIGVHQGRWDTFRRLVPHGLFAANPDFLQAIEMDKPRPYLWSLDDDIDGPIIVGRRMFFEGLAHMVDPSPTQMRGIWVRRIDTGQRTGLSFSFEMLKAFLKNRIQPDDIKLDHRCFRIATDLEEDDLIANVAEAVLGTGAIAANPGVRAGETSDLAAERDRAVNLAAALQAKAKAEGATYWVFFEPPPDDKLSEIARTQFEHLADRLVMHPNLRLILAGFEQYALAPLRFQRPVEAKDARRPGLLVDPLGPFSDVDIKVTLSEMLADLTGPDNFSQAQIAELITDITRNLTEERPGVYKFSQLAKAVRRIRSTVRLKAGL